MAGKFVNPDKENDLFMYLLGKLPAFCGYEQSFKMAECTLLTNRFLLGVHKDEIAPAVLGEVLEQMKMPDIYRPDLLAKLDDANIVLFGLEQNEKSCLYKIYLEFWDQVIREIRRKPDKTAPMLLFLGFKWDPADHRRGTVARYMTYPLLSLADIQKRLSAIYANPTHFASWQGATEILHLAASRVPDDYFIYLEAEEENNPRKSFDINLYKANFPLQKLYPLLSKLSQSYSIPASDFDRLFDPIRTKILGHLSGGIDREGKDFLTTYYEIDGPCQ